MSLRGLDPITTNKVMLALSSQILVSYGIYFTLNVTCLHYLIRNKKRNYVIVAYTVLSLIASTAFMAANVKSTEVIFIPSENNKALQKTILVTELVSYTSKLCLADSLLIYRLWIIYEGAWLIILFPLVLFTGTLGSVLADIIIIFTNAPNAIENLGVTMHACSITLNLLATSMIVVKLRKKRKWARNLGLDHAKLYLSMTAIFAESGALYSVVGIIYIPLLVLDNPVTFLYSTWMDAAAGIAPLLILLRLAFGVAISRDALTNLSNDINNSQQRMKASEIAFSPPGDDINIDIDSSVASESGGINDADERPKQEV